MFKLTALIGALVASLALAATASAAVTFDPATGKGFVGKGDVQVAFGWNNTQLQTNASGVSFSSKQAASQELSQSATQDGSMAVTQSVSREVSCVTDTGKKTFYREGTRSGTRSGSRDGTRDGSRSGTLVGSLVSALDGDPRKTKGQNQFTGFILKGYTAPGTPVFTATGSNEFGDWTFGDYKWAEEAELGDTEWGGWESESGENPASCLEPGNNTLVTELYDHTAYGDVMDGDVTDGAITEGVIVYGAITATGAAQLYATFNGVTRLL